MKGLDVGTILYECRQTNHFSQEEVCTGICSVSNYSKYETAEKLPDVFSYIFFCDRLGLPLRGMTAYICRADSDYWMWKRRMYRFIRTEDYAGLRENYPYQGKRAFLNKRLMEQYDWYIQGILAEKGHGDLKRANECYREAVKITCPALLEQNSPDGLYGRTELGLAVLYFHTLILLDESRQAYVGERAYSLINYVSRQQWDDESKCGIYAALVVLWCKCGAAGKSLEERLHHLQNAILLLRKSSETYHIVELYRQTIKVRRELGMSVEQEEEYRDIFTELFEEFQIPYEDLYDQVYDDEIMIQVIHSYLKKARVYANKSQEMVSDGICAVESYSRIESGRRLNRTHYQAISGKLGIEERYYYDLIKTSKAQAVPLRKEINEVLNRKEYELCNRRLEELQNLLGEEAKENEQYFAYQRARIRHETREYDFQQYYNALENALKYTCDLASFSDHTFTLMEIKIVNSMAVAQKNLEHTEKAINLLNDLLNSIELDFYGKEQNFMSMKLPRLNLGTFLTDVNRMKDAQNILYDTARESLLRNDCFHVDYLLAEYAYSFDGVDADLEIKFFTYARILAIFLSHKRYCRHIEETMSMIKSNFKTFTE